MYGKDAEYGRKTGENLEVFFVSIDGDLQFMGQRVLPYELKKISRGAKKQSYGMKFLMR